MCKSYDIQKKYLGNDGPWKITVEDSQELYFKKDFPTLAKAIEKAVNIMKSKNSPNYISDDEKLEMFEGYIFDLAIYISTGNREKVSTLLENACKFSYSYRVGNGELTEDERSVIIKRNFLKLRATENDSEKSSKSGSNVSCENADDSEVRSISEGD